MFPLPLEFAKRWRWKWRENTSKLKSELRKMKWHCTLKSYVDLDISRTRVFHIASVTKRVLVFFVVCYGSVLYRCDWAVDRLVFNWLVCPVLTRVNGVTNQSGFQQEHIKSRLHEWFLVCSDNAFFLIVTSLGLGENHMCSHPCTSDAMRRHIKKSQKNIVRNSMSWIFHDKIMENSCSHHRAPATQNFRKHRITIASKKLFVKPPLNPIHTYPDIFALRPQVTGGFGHAFQTGDFWLKRRFIVCVWTGENGGFF